MTDLRKAAGICMIALPYEDTLRFVDIGNYYIDEQGKRCVVTTKNLAEKYAHLCDVPVYVRKKND